MTSKFLYGKKEFLSDIIHGNKSPRFSDLTHYARLENNNMRDNEMSKTFIIDKDATSIRINGYILNPTSIVENPTLSILPQHCYCLCLSNKKNDPELFRRFKADICIEFDIEKLLKVLESSLLPKLSGLSIEARDIRYYDPKSPPETTDPKSIVFYKPNCFSPEAEFRIAIFYPTDKIGFTSDSGLIIPWQVPGDSLHLQFLSRDPLYIKQCIVGVYELSSSGGADYFH